jgi:hypothetical protein
MVCDIKGLLVSGELSMSTSRKKLPSRTPDPGHDDPRRDITPPPETQTDPGRGTGELGEEELDPSQPLPKPHRDQPKSSPNPTPRPTM